MNFFKKAIEDMAADSLRCVAIAYRDYKMEYVPTSEEELAHWSLPEDDLILLAIVGLKVCIFSRYQAFIAVIIFSVLFCHDCVPYLILY